LEEERFCPVFFEFPLIALKECYHAFRYLQSILTAGRVARFGARAFREFLVLSHRRRHRPLRRGRIRARQTPNFPKISANFFSNTSLDL
jgi:hypothetical protein